jgi:hypothetical protein
VISSNDAAVLNPQKVQKGRGQRHTEHTLGFSHHLVRQGLLDTVITVTPERRHDLIESPHGTQPTAQQHRLQLQDRFLVRKKAAGLVEIRERGRAVDVEHRHAHLPRVLKK